MFCLQQVVHHNTIINTHPVKECRTLEMCTQHRLQNPIACTFKDKKKLVGHSPCAGVGGETHRGLFNGIQSQWLPPEQEMSTCLTHQTQKTCRPAAKDCVGWIYTHPVILYTFMRREMEAVHFVLFKFRTTSYCARLWIREIWWEYNVFHINI